MTTVAVITTVRHNVGDDFVREGIAHLWQAAGAPGRLDLIHKHAPVTTVRGLERVRSLRASRIIDPIARAVRARDRVREGDLLLQSGAPVYWCHPGGPHCADNEWFDPIVRKRFLRDRRGRKFLNIAGGSCQRFHSNGTEVVSCTPCTAYIRELFDVCDLTILRDELAQRMLRLVGRDAAVLPCTSIFARDMLGLAPERGEYIVLNFMEKGGHFTFGQDIDGKLWREQFRQLARQAARHGRVVVACHNAVEDRLASELVPDSERFLVPNDHVEFMKFYARARFGIVNRVHAGFMMASFGKPAVVIGNDSRALMLRNLNLPAVFVGDVADVGVEAMLEDVVRRAVDYAEEAEVLRSRARDAYLQAIAGAIAS